LNSLVLPAFATRHQLLINWLKIKPADLEITGSGFGVTFGRHRMVKK